MKVSTLIAVLTLTLSLPGLGFAHTPSTLTTEASRMDSLAANQGQNNVINKISSDFYPFLGENAPAVVTGLRNGTGISLTTTTPGSTPGAAPLVNTTTIQPPTGKMGFGNVYISLALAKQQLNQMGITQPTPEQLQAVLLGGTVTNGSGLTATSTHVEGILQMRSEGMGWGQIAQKLGYKLGPVMSEMKSANQSLTTTTSGTSSTSVTTKGGKGIVNAGGKAAGSAESGIVSGSGKSHGHSGKGVDAKGDVGAGIVTGSGRPVGGQGNAWGHDKGAIVTGSGRVVGGTSGITTGGGHAYGLQGGKDSSNSGQARDHSK